MNTERLEYVREDQVPWNRTLQSSLPKAWGKPRRACDVAVFAIHLSLSKRPLASDEQRRPATTTGML